MSNASETDLTHVTRSIGCLDTGKMRAVRLPSSGFHCDVWQVSRLGGHDGWRRSNIDQVIKCHRESAQLVDLQVLNRDYRRLKTALEDMVPMALFVWTEVDGEPNCVVIAEAVRPWFNIANPINEEEVLPLLARLPKAKLQLARFLEAARYWDVEEGRVIDLWGLDNLVVDVDHDLRYIDSFRVFFFDDLLYAIDGSDPELEEKIAVSRQRREYLETLLADASTLTG
jgi:hypothetical protein